MLAAARAGVMPLAFLRMTLREVFIAIQAYKERREDEIEWMAWQTAALVNIHLPRGKGVTAYSLLGKEELVDRSAAFTADIDDLQERLGLKAAKRRAVSYWGHEDGPILEFDQSK